MIENAVLDRPYISERNEIVDKIKSILISSLNLNYTPEQIPADEILFGVGLGLDSIDSLKLTVDIKSSLGVEIGDEDMWALRSVNTLADYIMIDQNLLDNTPVDRLETYVADNTQLATYNQIRNEAILYENVENTVLRIQDDDAFFKLNNLVTKDIDFTAEGFVTQTMLLDENGSFLSHLYFINNFDHHYIISHKDDHDTILEQLSKADISYDDLTDKITCLSVDGYQSSQIMESCFDSVISSLKPFSFSMEMTDNNSEYLVLRLDTYGEAGFMLIAFDCDVKKFLLEIFRTNNILLNESNNVCR